MLIAVGLTPVQIWLRRACDRLVYGRRADPVAAVRDLGGGVASAGDADLLPWALGSVAASTGAQGAAVRGPDGTVIAAVGRRPARYQIGALRYGGRDLGMLWLATWYPAPPARGRAELALHRALVAQVAVVLRATRITAELSAERDRLVEAVSDERRRLRANLKGGLATLLDRIDQGLRMAAMSDPDTVHLNRAREAATLAARVRGGPLPALPSEVEIAVYRIVTEAMTNAARHADADRIEVSVTGSGRALMISVADDGHGFRDERVGVGLAGMMSRALAIGGHVEIVSGGAGTTVTAELPLPGDTGAADDRGRDSGTVSSRSSAAGRRSR
ncbi:sensor histidine kinase [Actinoplanes sp. CA-030573]|uniref:sensor histidine kinase n=1 Tax=Actinoplanes sp. CA-030573 TaxID=3239898 RepID=UPI003D906023